MDERPHYRSHWLPRTRDGWIATLAFLALFGLALPPATHTLWNRIEPTILGLPFLYVGLFGVYVALIGVLIWIWWRRV